MKTITLAATFDGARIRLQEDFPIPKNARLLVTQPPGRPQTRAPGVGRVFRAMSCPGLWAGRTQVYARHGEGTEPAL